jgi:hypothetical protein
MKNKLIYLTFISIIFYIVFISIGFCITRQETPVAEIDSGGDSGSHIPSCALDVTFFVPETNVERTDLIILYANYSINKSYGKNITDFSYVDYLNKTFKIVKIDGIDVKPSVGKIEINGSLSINKQSSKNWTLQTDIDTAIGSIFLFDSKMRKIGPFEGRGESKTKRITIKPYIYYSKSRTKNIQISIRNKPPEINENMTRVEVSVPQISEDQKLIYWDINNPLEVKQIVSATDIDDNNQLQYIWTLENENKSPIEFITNSSSSINNWKLKSGETYIFKVTAKDSDGNYSKNKIVNIVCKNNKIIYKSIFVPPWEFYSINLISILIIAIILSFISFTIKFKSDLCIRKRDIPKIFMYKFKKYFKNITINPLANALISIPIITILFIILFILNIKFWHIYSISLAFYELYPYTIVYILFGYLAEEHFFKTDKNSSKYNIILINDLLMIFILASFYGISSGITGDIYERLNNYYSTITQILGTLLGFILGFYIAKFNNAKKERSKVYLMTLEYLVLLYGTIIILSLWGLSMTETIYFTPLIEFNQENLTNIVSIWVFESTLLLSPLAITSLYRLIKAAN